MKNLILLSFLLLLVAGCARQPNGATVHQGEFSIAELFSHDGCKVYRFYDGGRNHYFSRCDQATDSSVMSTQSCGKGCGRSVTVPTSYKTEG